MSSKAPGIFIQIKTTVLTDDKLAAVGPEAAWMYVKGLCWSKEHLTDGEVRRGALAILGAGISDPEAAAQRLVDEKLWTVTENGWTVGAERWARHQETKAQVDARREADRERKKAGKKTSKKVSKKPAKTPTKKTSGALEDSSRNPTGSPGESVLSRGGIQHTESESESDTEAETESTPPRASEPDPAAPVGGGGGDAQFVGDFAIALKALKGLRVNGAEALARQAGSERVVLYAVQQAKSPGVKRPHALAAKLIREGEQPPEGWRSHAELEAHRLERNRLAGEQQAAEVARRKREYERDLAELALIRDHQDVAQATAEKFAKGKGFTPGALRKKPKNEWARSKLCRAEVLEAIEQQTGNTVENTPRGRESA
ncbi:MAG: hypothetical protein NCW75_05685 [Phycisphaera sp.]|nr:MAG: hypothetical protein NCW75_05685 [Phycisphaera sp.]